uniref:Uncharacterized protein n=1 Tax=Anopheles melas TaxID=34690 RepID=A0A182TFH2_9DIPT
MQEALSTPSSGGVAEPTLLRCIRSRKANCRGYDMEMKVKVTTTRSRNGYTTVSSSIIGDHRSPARRAFSFPASRYGSGEPARAQVRPGPTAAATHLSSTSIEVVRDLPSSK